MLWTSSNPAVAQVDENGRVLAISKGTATIQAEAADGSGCTASCTVTVTGNLNMVTSVEHFESSHPYQNNLSEVWLYQSPGAERITLTFSDDTEFEAPYDYLEIYANQNQLVGKYTGKELAGQKIVVSGESAQPPLCNRLPSQTRRWHPAAPPALPAWGSGHAPPSGVYNISW